MSMVLRPSDRAAVVGVVDPASLSATTHDTDWVDMGQFERLLGIVLVGQTGENATVDVAVLQATDSGGSDAKALVPAKAATQLDAAASPQPNNQQIIVNITGEELDRENDFTHVALRVTVGTAATLGAAVLLGLDPRYGPASDNDLSSVVEIVA